MSKSLKTLQVLARIGRILSKIIFIFSTIGAVGCLVGLISLAAGLDGTLKWGGVTFRGILEKEADLSIGTLYAAMAVGLIYSVVEAIISKFAEVYFRHELKAGTPFTLDGAKETLRLGILTIALPLGGTILAAIVQSILENVIDGAERVTIGSFGSVTLGVMFIVLSVVFRYGAELSAEKREVQ